MEAKRTMTLNLTASEMKRLEKTAGQKQMTKTAIIRSALRLYHLVDARLAAGGKVLVQDARSRTQAELLVL